MSDGSYERIDSIRPGDSVLSFNTATSSWESAVVWDQWSHFDLGLSATVTLDALSAVTATDDHLFWVETTKQWTELQNVAPGDRLLSPNGSVVVQAVTVGEGSGSVVWELAVGHNHNFTVHTGTYDLLVHNVGPCIIVDYPDDSTVIFDGDGNANYIDPAGNVFDDVDLDADGNPVTTSPSSGGEIVFTSQGKANFVATDGHVYRSVRTDAAGNVVTDGGGHPVYDTRGGSERSSALLAQNADGSFDTAGGLHYEAANPPFGDRVDHVLQHAYGNEKPNKTSHTVFPEGVDPIAALDEAWSSPTRLGPKTQVGNANDGVVATIQDAAGNPLTVFISLQPGTNTVVTAFPIDPANIGNFVVP